MHDDFEAGQIDKFNVTATDVGDITMIQMSMRTVIPGCSWLLDLVTVTNLETKKTSHFPCNQWLTTTQCFITLRSSDGKQHICAKHFMKLNRPPSSDPD